MLQGYLATAVKLSAKICLTVDFVSRGSRVVGRGSRWCGGRGGHIGIRISLDL